MSYTLKNAFADAYGVRTSKRDALDYSTSLDAPIGNDDEDNNLTLGDTIADERSEKALDDADYRIFTENLKIIIEKSLANLPSREARVDNDYFRMVIPYHKSGMNLGVAI